MSEKTVSKKPKANGFMLFAKEHSRKNRLNMKTSELVDMVKPFWEDLTNEERIYYKDMAKGIQTVQQKQQTLCESLMTHLVLEENSEDQMNLEVKNLIEQAALTYQLHSKIFYIINGSSFLEMSDTAYPAEFAIAAFNLRDGITDVYSTSINPGRLPPGFNDQSLSDKTFKYQVPFFDDIPSDYKKIFNSIMYLTEDATPLIFFCNGSYGSADYKTNVRVMKKIFVEAGKELLASKLKVYPYHMLLFHLKYFTLHAEIDPDFETLFSSLEEAYETIMTQEDLYTLDRRALGCEYHETNNASLHCCLSKARQYCFITISFCADPTQYKVSGGKHFPLGFRLA